MNKLIEIFKAGKHTAMSGETLTFSQADLQAAVAAYDPQVYEAPLVVGHPKLDDPAYGWAQGLSLTDDGKLLADPHQVDTEFSEIVNQGRFKKVSASFFAPDAPNNPKPGVWYLKHIGFLGAAAPAVKGLKSVAFAQNEQGVYEFTDWDQMSIASMFRRLREYIIGKDGIETADATLPAYEIEGLQINAVQEAPAMVTSSFSETQPDLTPKKDNDMTPEQQAEFDALKAENQALKDKEAAFAQAELSNKAQTIHAANVAFADALTQAGKLLPVHKDALVATLNTLDAPAATVEFGEGDAKAPLSSALKAMFEAMPKKVDFSEHGANKDTGKVVSFAAPHGHTVSQEGLELNSKANEYAKTHKVDYLTAVNAVSKGT